MVGTCIGQRLQSICVEQAFRSTALHPDEGLDEAIGSTAMGGHVAALLSTTAVTTKQHVKHSDAQELTSHAVGTLSSAYKRQGRQLVLAREVSTMTDKLH